MEHLLAGTEERSEAYRCGWLEGCFGEVHSFVHNAELARWQDPHDRLDYYRGHRTGREMRLAREHAA